MGKSDSVPRNQGSISSTHSFYARRSRKRKKLLDLTDFFALLLSACIEAEHKHVDEIDPKCDCILKRNMNMQSLWQFIHRMQIAGVSDLLQCSKFSV